MSMRPPTEPIDASPQQVADRLTRQLLTVRSVWFPTRNELRDWNETRSPLYVRWLGDHRFEVGPRLVNMWAACFSPVVRGALEADPQGTRMRWERGFPRFTRAVQGFWVVLLAAWFVALVVSVGRGTEPAGVFGFWLLLAGSTVVSTAVGGRMGGRALDEALPWMVEIASQPPVDEDW